MLLPKEIRIGEARHVYSWGNPDEGNSDDNACHVLSGNVCHMSSGGGVPTMPPFLTCLFCLSKMGGLKNNSFLKLRLLFCLIGPRGERGRRGRKTFMMSRRLWVFPGSVSVGIMAQLNV